MWATALHLPRPVANDADSVGAPAAAGPGGGRARPRRRQFGRRAGVGQARSGGEPSHGSRTDDQAFHRREPSSSRATGRASSWPTTPCSIITKRWGFGLRGLPLEARRGGGHEAALQYAMRASPCFGSLGGASRAQGPYAAVGLGDSRATGTSDAAALLIGMSTTQRSHCVIRTVMAEQSADRDPDGASRADAFRVAAPRSSSSAAARERRHRSGDNSAGRSGNQRAGGASTRLPAVRERVSGGRCQLKQRKSQCHQPRS